MSKVPAIFIHNTEELPAEGLLSELNDLHIDDRKDARGDGHPASPQYDMSFRHADDYGKKFLEVPKPSDCDSDSEAARAQSSTKASSEPQCELTATESIDRNGQKLAVQSAPHLSESDRKTDVLGLGVWAGKSLTNYVKKTPIDYRESQSRRRSENHHGSATENPNHAFSNVGLSTYWSKKNVEFLIRCGVLRETDDEGWDDIVGEGERGQI
ncbi:hypothetical protein CTAM01_13950 [Colletotrichum tamarilloi]|uniref:Uncharacterized protein n=1 Tax=Colletotrichum tamarilloi TaxID=1209934 RepID=A0ABQ9QQJ8_9PEZI|nr:uncharacterized protein CTAM01_13950 [Colletotrichum tamarilloi]KAK1481593.1 hypothetical protein CTAM01_13950 [Colletotrichum tamarilloi]